jgi:hypothetical protein
MFFDDVLRSLFGGICAELGLASIDKMEFLKNDRDRKHFGATYRTTNSG